MAYSIQDKHEIAFQNANNAAAVLVRSVVVGAGSDYRTFEEVYADFMLLRDRIFESTKAMQSVVVPVQAPPSPSVAAASSGVILGDDNSKLPRRADGSARYKGPKGIFENSTLGEIVAHPQGVSYLKFLQGQQFTDAALRDAIVVLLERHGKA